jgi:iron complex outermembrane receptor protein
LTTILHTGNVEAVLAKSGDRFNVSLPLLDAAGHTIGVLAVGFPYKPGVDKATLLRAAEQLRDDLKGKIPDVQTLFGSGQ